MAGVFSKLQQQNSVSHDETLVAALTLTFIIRTLVYTV